jgi:hypothetical protein
VPLAQGDLAVFAVNQRPMRGVRGDYRVAMRHGVSALRSGERHTLGIIFTMRASASSAALTTP